MPLTLTIFSGLPGTGKSTLANRLARELCQPLLRIDDVAACMPAEVNRENVSFWDGAITAMLLLAEAQLQLGVSIILDSIFMNLDRFYARAIARRYEARFLPVYVFISDEKLWRERAEKRFATSASGEGVASWEQIQAQQPSYRPWEPATALCLDAVRPEEENYATLLACFKDEECRLLPLPEVAFTPGKYHGF